jgi:hypothetical protein
MALGSLQRSPFFAVRAVDGAHVYAMASSVDEVNAQRVPRTSASGGFGACEIRMRVGARALVPKGSGSDCSSAEDSQLADESD